VRDPFADRLRAGRNLELILVDVIPHVSSIRDIYSVKLNYNAPSFSFVPARKEIFEKR